MKRYILAALLIFCFSDAIASSVGASGLPLPRFVSLRASEANVRTGPGMQYPKQWVLVKQNIPLEIISEYEDWRKIRDIQGDEGWIHKAMLSGKRTAIIRKNGANIYRNSDTESEIKAVLEKAVVVNVDSCSQKFCKIDISDIEGYILQTDLWGVYIGERVE